MKRMPLYRIGFLLAMILVASVGWSNWLLITRATATQKETGILHFSILGGIGLSLLLVGGSSALVLYEGRLRRKAMAQRDRFFEHSIDLVGIAGMDGYYKQVNPAFARALGYNEEELLAKPFLEFVHPEDRGATLKELELLRTGVPSTEFENRYRCKDGSWKWISWRTQPFVGEGMMFASGRDITELKMAEASLNRAREEAARERERLKFIFDELPLGIALNRLSADGHRTTMINAAHLSICGITREQAHDPAIFRQITPSEDYQRQLPLLAKLDSGELDRISLDKRYIRPDGEVVWVLLTITRRRLSPTEFEDLSFVLDITERKKMEESLRLSEENLAVTLHSIGDAVLSTDLKGNVTRLNLVAEQLTGWTAQEAVGRPVAEIFKIINEQTGAPAEIPLEEVMRTGQIRGLANHTALVARDGSVRSIADSAAPIHSRDGDLIGSVLVFRDVTEANRLHTALHESEILLRAILNSMQANIAVIAKDGKITACNDKWLKEVSLNGGKAGLPGAQLGADYLKVCREAARELGLNENILSDGIHLVMERPEKTFRYEYPWPTASGPRWLAMHVAPLRRGEGGVVVAHIDTTDRKLAEVALQESEERLNRLNNELQQHAIELEDARSTAERANHAKSEYLSRMSHELRTPLNAILGFGQLLEQDVTQPEDVESVAQILKAGRHLLEMINELLDIASIEAGRMRISPEPVSLDELFVDCLHLIKPLAKDRNIQLEEDFTIGTERHVLADRQRLKQVLLNLLSNAIKYNRSNGRVALSSVSILSEGKVQINVIDTGPGIVPENVERLFAPFERLDLEHPRIEGTGLGLALSKRLVELMGGQIGVESIPGQGSCFWVKLAIADAPVVSLERELKAVHEPKLVEGDPSEKKTILYIEDNLSNMRLIERILEQRPGVHLIPAMQGNLGLELACQHRPDLILLDLNLPDIDGQEVLLRLLAEPSTAHIPIVIISADATPREIGRLRAAGARDYLTKPLEVAKFLRVLDRYLSRSAA